MDEREVKKLADLARIEMSDEEISSIAKDVGEVVNYVKEIQDAVGGKEVTANRNVDAGANIDLSTEIESLNTAFTSNVFREDENPNESGSQTETLLAEVPERQGDYIKVKRILKND